MDVEGNCPLCGLPVRVGARRTRRCSTVLTGASEPHPCTQDAKFAVFVNFWDETQMVQYACERHLVMTLERMESKGRGFIVKVFGD